MKTFRLFRPIGLRELELVAELKWKGFPPRLEWQPIFYPVLNQPYAEQIAQQWNTNDAFSGYCGVVTAFDIDSDYMVRYETQNVGGNMHNELWVPAEKLGEFNEHIIGSIRVVNVFFGDQFEMPTNGEIIDVLLKCRV